MKWRWKATAYTPAFLCLNVLNVLVENIMLILPKIRSKMLCRVGLGLVLIDK